MRLWHACFPNAVALLGTSLLSALREWFEKAPGILLMLDGDAAGWKTAGQIAASFAGKTKVAIHHLPHGYDPDDRSDRQLRSVNDRSSFMRIESGFDGKDIVLRPKIREIIRAIRSNFF